MSRTHVRPESNTMFSECIRGTRRLRSLSDLRARPARTSPLTCMFADRIPGKVRNAGEARAAASLAARFGRQTGPRSGRRSFSREYLRTCMYQQSFISLALFFLSFCHSPAPVLCTYLPAILSTNALTLIYIAAWLSLKNAGSIADGICIHRLFDRFDRFKGCVRNTRNYEKETSSMIGLAITFAQYFSPRAPRANLRFFLFFSNVLASCRF